MGFAIRTNDRSAGVGAHAVSPYSSIHSVAIIAPWEKPTTMVGGAVVASAARSAHSPLDSPMFGTPERYSTSSQVFPEACEQNPPCSMSAMSHSNEPSEV